MHDSFGDPFVIEMRDLLAEDEILEERRPAKAGFQGILIAADRHALIGGEHLTRRIHPLRSERAIEGLRLERRCAALRGFILLAQRTRAGARRRHLLMRAFRGPDGIGGRILTRFRRVEGHCFGKSSLLRSMFCHLGGRPARARRSTGRASTAVSLCRLDFVLLPLLLRVAPLAPLFRVGMMFSCWLQACRAPERHWGERLPFRPAWLLKESWRGPYALDAGRPGRGAPILM